MNAVFPALLIYSLIVFPSICFAKTKMDSILEERLEVLEKALNELETETAGCSIQAFKKAVEASQLFRKYQTALLVSGRRIITILDNRGKFLGSITLDSGDDEAQIEIPPGFEVVFKTIGDASRNEKIF